MVSMKEEKKASLKSEMEQKIALQFSDYVSVDPSKPTQSREYKQFLSDNAPTIGGKYEKICRIFGKLPAVKLGAEYEKKIKDSLDTCHMSLEPKDTIAFALYGPIVLAFFLVLSALVITQSMLMAFVALAGAFILMYPALNLPIFFADRWRMRAGNQMVLATFYIVTYMRHTSNLERAVQFASDHLGPPLSLDFRKILWDVETEEYDSIGTALDNYLEQWRESNGQFVEAMQLIQSSLYEEQESKRLQVLDKALDITLDQTYERMLHYAHNLQSPITTLHMLGVILPILGLVILPLMIAFMPEVRWYHVAVIYNIIIPVSVYMIGVRVLSSRPSSYGSGAIDETNPELMRRQQASKWSVIKPSYAAITIIILFLVIGLFPVWAFWIAPDFDIGWGNEVPGSDCGRQYCLLGYHPDLKDGSPTYGSIIGPYGLGASLLSLFIPLGLGLGFAVYFALKSQYAIDLRRETEMLESEFGSALFQVSNRLDDGIPPEAAVGHVAANMPDSPSGNFFRHLSSNIQKLGMSLHEAIFNPQIGALVRYPSNLIESSMKVLVESSKKGPRIAAQALGNISRYLKEMHRVEERLKDLMAEVLSSMRSQISFLTPIIAGIVIGITSMITTILSQLSRQLGDVSEDAAGDVAVGGMSGISDLFYEGMPTYHFQVIVGLYVVQIVYILTIMINGISNGVDPLEERYLLSKNLLKSVGLYILIAGAVMLAFNMIAGSIVGSALIS